MTSARVRLTFPEELIRQPILARLVREFDVVPNIRQAKIEEAVGWVVCELDGDEGAVERALEWMRANGMQVDRLSDPLES